MKAVTKLAIVNHIDGELQTELLSLTKYGRPRISLSNGGWNCSIKMNTNADGASFDISSGFNSKTPLEAVVIAKKRAQKAVKTISESI